MPIQDYLPLEQELDKLADLFEDASKSEFDEDPGLFEGRSTKASWNAQCSHAADELREELNDLIEKIEGRLHDGEFA